MKKLCLSITLALWLVVLCYGTFLVVDSQKVTSKTAVKIPDFTTIIHDQTKDWPTDGSYNLPFLRVESIAFARQNDDLFIRYDLAGTMPANIAAIPVFKDDPIKGVYYSMKIDQNYFDGLGRKNPSSFESVLLMEFYGQDVISPDSKKVNVNGELVGGGAGFDYFVAKYPYSQILFGASSQVIVFESESKALSERNPLGASYFKFSNYDLSATKENDSEILVNLEQKNTVSF